VTTEERLPLPPGWAWASIGDLTELKVAQGGPSVGSTFTYVDISSVDNRAKRITEPKIVPTDAAPTRARQQIRAGDVLVSMTRPNLNAVALVPAGLEGSIGSTGFDVLRPIGIDPRWIYFFVQTRPFVDSMSARVQGALYPAVRPKDIRAFSLPVAPLAEQHRIVEAIEARFTQLDAVVASLKRVRANVRGYRASVLLAAITGRLVETEAVRSHGQHFETGTILLARILGTPSLAGRKPKPESSQERPELPGLPHGWAWARIKQVGDVQLGRQRAPQHHSGTHMRPYLRVANVFEDRIDLSDVHWMNFTPQEFEKYKLDVGDILLNEGQTPELVGRPAIIRADLPGYCFQNTLVRFRAYEGVLPEYALIVFRAYVHGQRFMRIAQITTNIAHLGAERFSEVEFPLPPLGEQHRIVAEVQRRLSVADEIATEVDAGLARCVLMRRSTLMRAFEGRLVPQDLNDEPAAALIARTRS
jgi:type I restriction enzyme S subunit